MGSESLYDSGFQHRLLSLERAEARQKQRALCSVLLSTGFGPPLEPDLWQVWICSTSMRGAQFRRRRDRGTAAGNEKIRTRLFPRGIEALWRATLARTALFSETGFYTDPGFSGAQRKDVKAA